MYLRSQVPLNDAPPLRPSQRCKGRGITRILDLRNSRVNNNWVLSLNSVYGYERAINENARCTLLMHDRQSASGGSHGVHHMLLSSPAMHTLRQTRRYPSGPSWSRSRHSSAAVHQVEGHV